MALHRYIRLVCTFLLFGLFASCDEDIHRGAILSGKWFGDLGMMVDGEDAIGSVIEFVPDQYTYTSGYGYEIDYYHGYYGLATMEHQFEWMIRDGIIYLRFDNPDLDCNIRDYSLSPNYFRGYLDGIYSSTRFDLRGYDRYWDKYGYYDDDYGYYSDRSGKKVVKSQSGENAKQEVPVCVRKQNTQYGEAN